MCKYLLLIVLFVLLSCNSNETNIQTEILSNSNIAPIDYTELSKILDYTVDYIPLETSEDCLTGEISSLSRVDNRFFIHSKLSNIEKILIFDSNGNFINKVGDYGRAQNEYLNIKTFVVDKINQHIIIIDSHRLRLLRYDFDGNYISSADIDKQLRFANKIVQLSDGTYLVTFGIYFKGGENLLYAIYSSDFKEFDIISSTKLHFNGDYNFSTSPISVINKDVLCIEPLNNTIYTLSIDKSYIPKYEVSILNEDKPITNGEYTQHFGSMKNYISGIIVIQNYLIINYGGRSVIYNSKTKNGYLLSDNYNLSEFDKFPLIPSSIKLSEGNKLYSILDSYTANSYCEEIEMIDEDFKQMVSKIDYNSNPILIQYQIE